MRAINALPVFVTARIGSVAHSVLTTPSTNLNYATAIVYCFVISMIFQNMEAWKTIF
jgi:hypothetical protein